MLTPFLNSSRLRRLAALITPHSAVVRTGPDAARRVRLTATLSLVLSALLFIYLVETIVTEAPTMMPPENVRTVLAIAFSLCSLVYALSRTRYGMFAGCLMVIANILAVSLSIAFAGDPAIFRFVSSYLIMPIVVATLVLEPRGVFYTSVFSWLSLELVGLWVNAPHSTINDARFFFVIVASLIVIGYSMRLNDVEKGRVAAQRAYERLDGILRLAPIGIFETDLNAGCTFTNGRAAELFGLPTKDCLGEGWRATLSHDDRDRVGTEWHHATASRIPLSYDAFYIRPDGNEIMLHIVAEPIRNTENGAVFGYLGAAIDVTETRRAHRELEEERARHIESSKLASLGEMAGGVAHEINNPLTIIDGKTRMARRAAETGDQNRLFDHLMSIEKNAARIAKIVHGLRSATRDGRGDPFAPERLGTIMDDALALCRERILSRGVRLEDRTAAAAEETVECRATQIVQVLVNLLSNAFDAAAETADPWIVLDVKVTATDIILSVGNAGTPIPAAVREKMFRPFFTTKEVGKGTGLGLSISMGLAHDHGGALDYDASSPTPRFTLRLPKRRIMGARKVSA